MNRFAKLACLLTLAFAVGLASACSGKCEENPEEGVYCQQHVTGL
jgi:hypothetical protein